MTIGLILNENFVKENWEFIQSNYTDKEYKTSEEFINACKNKEIIIGGALLIISERIRNEKII